MLNPPLIALLQPPAHLAGTLLPRGFFIGLGLIYLAALAADRLAARWRLPGAAAVLVLSLAIPDAWLSNAQGLGAVQLETLHRVSLALLIFFAGLRTNLRRIHGLLGAGLRLASLGVLITLAVTGLVLQWLAPLLLPGLPPAAAWLAVCCLGATDSSAIEDLSRALNHGISGRLRQLLLFEAALSIVVTLLCFGVAVGLLQGHLHSDHQGLPGLLTSHLPQQLGVVGLHLVAGLLAGLCVGVVAPRLIDGLVRSDELLLLVAVALAFVAYGLGQLLGGGGLLAVFVAGLSFANGRERVSRFEPQALARVMHPLNTAAEMTVLLLLGLLVQPAALLSVVPLGLLLALVLPLARGVAVAALLPSASFSGQERLVLTGGGLRAAVPLALAVSMTEELPHLRGVTPALAESLGAQLLALIFVVVLVDLLLQPLLLRAQSARQPCTEMR